MILCIFCVLQVEGTALISACVRGRTAIAKALIEHPDIDVNLQGQVSTVLHQFIIPFCCVKLQILTVQNKRSALTTASFFGYVEIVEMLLAHTRTDVNLHGKVSVSY